MGLIAWMQPRDHREAGRTLGLLIAVAVGVTVLTFPVSGQGAVQADPVLLLFAVASFAVMIAMSVLAHYLSESSRWAWALCPLVAVVANTLIGLGTGDASIGAQVFFVFCAIYGAAILPPAGAAVMTAASVAGEAVLVFAQLPPGQALNNWLYLSATLVTTAYLLGRGNARVARLVCELEERAATDSLTGLVNRRTLDRALERALRDRELTQGSSLILLDVDHFKAINDEFGHPRGDDVLVQLAALILEGARSQDVVCRMGGDELAVLMVACGPETARSRAADLVARVGRHRSTIGSATGISVSVSAGLAHSPSHGETTLGLYSSANSALYAAKRAGRNRLVPQSGLGSDLAM